MKIKIRFFFAWFDFWVGFYYDRKKGMVYACPLPCCVFEIRAEFGADCPKCPHRSGVHTEHGCMHVIEKLDTNFCPCRLTRKSIEGRTHD